MADREILARFIIKDDGTLVLQNMGKEAEKTGKKLQDVPDKASSKWKTFFEFMKHNYINLSAGFHDAMAVINKAVEYMTLGAKAMQAEEAFRNVAESAGKSADAILAAMKKMSGGTIDQSHLAQKALKAMAIDIPAEAVVQLTGAARIAARVTGQTVDESFDAIIDSISSGLTRSLKRMTLLTKDQMKLINRAMAEGIDVDIWKFVVANAAEKMGKMKGVTDNAAESLQRYNAAVNEFKESIGKGMIILLPPLIGVIQELAFVFFLASASVWKIASAFDYLKSKIGITKEIRKEAKEWYEISKAAGDAALEIAEKAGKGGLENLGISKPSEEIADPKVKAKADAEAKKNALHEAEVRAALAKVETAKAGAERMGILIEQKQKELELFKLNEMEKLDIIEQAYKKKELTDEDYYKKKKEILTRTTAEEIKAYEDTRDLVNKQINFKIEAIDKTKDESKEQIRTLEQDRMMKLADIELKITKATMDEKKVIRDWDTEQYQKSIQKQMDIAETAYRKDIVFINNILEKKKEKMSEEIAINKWLYDQQEITGSELFRREIKAIDDLRQVEIDANNARIASAETLYLVKLKAAGADEDAMRKAQEEFDAIKLEAGQKKTLAEEEAMRKKGEMGRERPLSQQWRGIGTATLEEIGVSEIGKTLDNLKIEQEAIILSSQIKIDAEKDFYAQKDLMRQRDHELEVAKIKAGLLIAGQSFGALGEMAYNYYELSGKQSKEAFRVYQAFAIAQAIIDTIVGAQAAYRAGLSVGGYAGVILAPLYAAMAIVQGMARVAAIRAQTAHEGGLITGSQEEPLLRAQRGEYIVSKRGVETLDKINEGKIRAESNQLQQPINVTIQTFDSKSFESYLKYNKNSLNNAIREAKSFNIGR